MATFVFRAKFARRLPDPNFHEDLGIERHMMFINVKDVPPGMPLDPNARQPNINRRVYKEIEASLLDEADYGEPGSFHLKHGGITVLADQVTKSGDEYRVRISEGQGIIDGGHSYRLIEKHLSISDLPDSQFVKFEILTRVPLEWVTDLARGLNTSVQVQAMSLDDLAHRFDDIKTALADEIYIGQIAWREGHGGTVDARDIVGLMTLFNIDEFPNDTDTVPVMGYEKKSKALSMFEERPEGFKKVIPILRDILYFHDTIRKDARDLHNKAGGRAGALAFIEKRKRGSYEFIFKGEKGEEEGYRLMNGALYPMLSAFRWYVEHDPNTGDYRWRGGFSKVLKAWEKIAADLMKITQQASDELGRNPNAIGKSRNHWSNLHRAVAMKDMLARTGGIPVPVAGS